MDSGAIFVWPLFAGAAWAILLLIPVLFAIFVVAVAMVNWGIGQVVRSTYIAHREKRDDAARADAVTPGIPTSPSTITRTDRAVQARGDTGRHARCTASKSSTSGGGMRSSGTARASRAA